MIVVIAIIGILSIIVLVGHSTFNKTLVLANTAYDVALLFRSAETYGITSRFGGANTNASYGLDFNSGTPTQIILFGDTNPSIATKYGAGATPDKHPGDGYYTSGSDYLSQTYTLNNGMKVSNFCALQGALSYCWSGGTSPNMTRLDVVYARPNTFASTTPFASNGLPITAIYFTKACVTLTSPQGGSRSVSTNYLGEIQATSTCP